jgi:hypothetical protein
MLKKTDFISIFIIQRSFMAKLKIAKSFNKMSLSEQESYLVNKIYELHALEDTYRKMLGKIRGGSKQSLPDDDERPDLIELKSA